MADQVASSSSKVPAQRPAISRWVIFKLLGFTAGMFVLPIATYYYTVNGVFEGMHACIENKVRYTIYKLVCYQETVLTRQERQLEWQI